MGVCVEEASASNRALNCAQLHGGRQYCLHVAQTTPGLCFTSLLLGSGL
jgi:hypothetical protein